jgi:hypothetical protein
MRERKFIVQDHGSWTVRVPPEEIDVQAPDSLRQMVELEIERLSEE